MPAEKLLNADASVDLDPLPVSGKPKEESDQLEHSLLPAVNSEEAELLARTIDSDFLAAIDDRSEWEKRLAEWEDAYYGRMPSKDFPWPGAANFHVPLTMMGIETYKPRLIEAVLGQEPPVMIVPIESSDEQRRDRVELFLNWQIRTEMDIASVVAESAHIFLNPGTVIAKTVWETNRKHRTYVREFPAMTPLGDILSSLWGENLPQDLEKKGELTWVGTIPTSPKTGGPLDVMFTLKFLDDGIQVKVEEETLTQHPMPHLIEPPDFICPAKGGSDIQRLPWCQHRMWMGESDLRAATREGRFDKKQVDKLLLRAKGPSGDLSQQDSLAYREGVSSTEGIEDQGESNVRADQYAVLEDYRYYDINDDGVDEHIITWYCQDLPGEILGWDLLDNVYAHGRRPFRVGRFFPIPFRFYGLSFAEVIRGIQDETNTIHNQRVDYGTIQNLPFFFYRASSTLAPFPARLKPGEGVPVDNPTQDINFPKWQGSPAFGQQEEAVLMQYYERVTGLTDLTLGRQPNRVGATRTAAGTSTLLSEAGLRQKTALEAFQRFWTGIFEDILALDQEYLPAGKEFRVTGRLPELVRLKDRNEIQGRYDVRLTSTSESMNRVVAREDATILMQALLNPALIQVGIVGMKGVQRILQDFFRAYGKDPDSYLEIQAVPHSPEEELAMILSGTQVKPVAGMDIAGHIQAHQLQLANPIVRSTLGVKGVQDLMRLVMEETQLAQAQVLAQTLGQGGPQRPAGQQGLNAQTGQNAPQPNQPSPSGTNLPSPGAGKGVSPNASIS